MSITVLTFGFDFHFSSFAVADVEKLRCSGGSTFGCPCGCVEPLVLPSLFLQPASAPRAPRVPPCLHPALTARHCSFGQLREVLVLLGEGSGGEHKTEESLSLQ